MNNTIINGENMITTGALSDEDFEEWLANSKFLDVSERLSQEDGYYLIQSVSDFKELLAFGQDATLKFKLTNDLDLGGEPNFYIPYLAGEFDGNGHIISNLKLNLDAVSPLGLFGYLILGGNITEVGVENVNVTGDAAVGGLVGYHYEGQVTDCYSTGAVEQAVLRINGAVGQPTGASAGGLVGGNDAYVGRCYATGDVNGHAWVGGLVGDNGGTIEQCYSIGVVTGRDYVGGLVGGNRDREGEGESDGEN